MDTFASAKWTVLHGLARALQCVGHSGEKGTDSNPKQPLGDNAMKSIHKNLFVAAAILLTTGAVAVPALARGVSAYAGGRSAYPADANCFTEQWGAAVNTCSTTKSYVISLPVDSPGYKDVWVAAYGPSATSDVSCKAIAESADLTTTWQSGYVNLPAYGTPQTISILDQAYIPGAGVLWVRCQVAPGARIHSVSFEY